MEIFLTDFNKDYNIGLYAFCTDKYCLIGTNVKDNVIKKIKDVLKVPVHKIMVCGTDLVGVFCAGNSKKLLLPSIVFDEELKIIEKLGIDYEIVDSNLTALGNNIVASEDSCIVNPEFSANIKKKIRQALDVKLKPGLINELGIVGSLLVLKEKVGIIGRGASVEEKDYITDLFNIELEEATVNKGSSFVKAGVICNKNGLIISSGCYGPEAAHIDEIFSKL